MDPLQDPLRRLNDQLAPGGSSEMLRPPERLVLASSANETQVGVAGDNHGLIVDLGWVAGSAGGSSGGATATELAQSWLLILFVAPILIVPLIWLLLLLSQRAKQARLLLVSGLPDRISIVSPLNASQLIKQQIVVTNLGKNNNNSTSKQPATTSSRESGAHYLLDSSSSSSGTSSSTNSSNKSQVANMILASSSSAVAGGVGRSGSNIEHVASPMITSGCSCEKRRIKAESKCIGALHSLVEHMHLYLITLTYQEILGCLVSFTIAILNVVRMRNLFSCNLVIFILITSKLLNLLTLTTFALSKLVKLFRLKPLRSPSSNQHHHLCCARRVNHFSSSSQESPTNGSQKAGGTINGEEKSTTPVDTERNIYYTNERKLAHKISRSEEGEDDCEEGEEDDEDSLQVCEDSTTTTASCRLTDTSDKKPNGGARKQCYSAPYDANATICPLIGKESSSALLLTKSQQHQQRVGASSSITSGSNTSDSRSCYLSGSSSSCAKSRAKGGTCKKQALTSLASYSYPSEPIAWRLMLLLLLSASLALVCLYLRLMPAAVVTQLTLLGGTSAKEQQSSGSLLTTSNSSRWNSLLADSSTRYTTTTSTSTTSTPPSAAEAQQSNGHQTSSWVSRIQQSSQLRLLIDQYKLQTFAHLLLDSQLQTSRFMCTLAAGNYAPATQLAMTCLYGSLMLLIFLSSLAIGFLGKRKLHRFEATASSLAHHPLCQPSELLHRKMNIVSPASGGNSLLPSQQHQYQRQLDPFFLLSSSKQTDSNRKRYSELLKQNMRHHQSALEVLAVGAQMSRLGAISAKSVSSANRAGGKLRNSSSMSSLLAPLQGSFWPATATASAEQSSYAKQQHQVAVSQQQAAINRQQQHLRKLIGAQSMANLNQLVHYNTHLQQAVNNNSSSSSSGKLLPAGKLASSNGQLAWLPLGSAATVASLSNIGQPARSSSTGGSSSRAGKHLGATEASGTPPRNRKPLRSIGENLATENCAFASAQKQEEKEARRRNSSNSNQVSSNQRAARRGATSTSGSQQYQQQVAASAAIQQQYYEAALNRLGYLELKRDLRLAQAVILFGQLLDHAPILILLALSTFLPEGLLAGWNSTHDNGFVWLTLMEALALPILLCSVDTRLAQALRRSFRCSSSKSSSLCSHRRIYNSPSSPLASGYLRAGSASLMSRCDNTGARLANYGADLVLGPSASYPDFMFVCPRKSSTTTGSAYASQYSPAGANACQAPAGISRSSFGCHSLTGPPYPPASARPLAIDTSTPGNRESQRTNFALIAKARSKQEQQQQMFFARLKSSNANGLTNSAGSPQLIDARRRGRRRRHANAILSATRKLFRLNREPILRKSRVHASSSSSSTGYLHPHHEQVGEIMTTASKGTGGLDSGEGNHKKGGTAGTGRMSPTSSLSTLIRKFNHDNYTNVCQQYEQRKQQIAVEVSSSCSSESKLEQTRGQEHQHELLIDGLDGSTGGRAAACTGLQSMATRTGNLLDTSGSEDGGILCRKGGLYYNYCLDTSNPEQPLGKISALTARVNPILLNAATAIRYPAKSTDHTGSKTEILLDVLSDSPDSSGLAGNSSAVSIENRVLNSNTQEPQLNLPVPSKQHQLREPLQVSTSGEPGKKGNSSSATALDSSKTNCTSQSGKENNNSSPTNSKEKRGTQNGAVGGRVGQKSTSSSASNNQETIISNISSVQELLDKMNGIMNGKQVEPAATSGKQTDVMKQADGSSFGNRQESAISSGCGELLSSPARGKANNKSASSGLITNNNKNHHFDQLQANAAADTCANQAKQSTTSVPVTGGGATIEQSTHHHLMLDGNLDYASLRSMEDALSLVSVSSEFEYHNINLPTHLLIHQQPASHSTRNGSVKQQQQQHSNHWFEPILAAQPKWNSIKELEEQEEREKAQVVFRAEKKERQHNNKSSISAQKYTNQPETRRSQDAVVPRVQDNSSKKVNDINNNNSNLMQLTSSSHSSSSSMENKRLEDLRFPSFLPTKQPVNQAFNEEPSRRLLAGNQLKSAHPAVTSKALPIERDSNQLVTVEHPEHLAVIPPKISQKQSKSSEDQQQRQNVSISASGLLKNIKPTTNSSSLLNLSAAKFAAMSSNMQQHLGPVKVVESPHKLETSAGNTITKQKASAGSRIVTLNELSGKSRVGNQLLPDGKVECSLPAENGHVRATIRKMEQQSTPNLNSSQRMVLPKATTSGSSTGSAGTKQASNHTNASLIPLVTSSKLPVPVHANQNPLNNPLGLNSSRYSNPQNNPKTQRHFSTSDGQQIKRPRSNISAKHYS